MITAQEISEILAQYKKHGWKLSRVLLSAKTGQNLADSLESLFGSVEIIPADLDAAWFSRASGEDRETWELRRLGGTPFALVEVFETDDDEEIREEIRQEIQTRLRK